MARPHAHSRNFLLLTSNQMRFMWKTSTVLRKLLVDLCKHRGQVSLHHPHYVSYAKVIDDMGFMMGIISPNANSIGLAENNYDSSHVFW